MTKGRPALSPDGRFVVYFDIDMKSVLSQDIASGAVRDISRGIGRIGIEMWAQRPIRSMGPTRRCLATTDIASIQYKRSYKRP